MSDRDIFKENLNYYLAMSGKMQKDLAEYVGAKTTTVSGWTRGISYPRADSMEKIAMFFGIPTSKLVGEPALDSGMRQTLEMIDSIPRSQESRIISAGIDKMPPERREQALRILQVAFSEYADYFKEEHHDDT